MSTVAFQVPGLPQPQGSARGFVVNGRAVVTHDNTRVRSWRVDVECVAQDQWQGKPVLGEALVIVHFHFPRPRAHYGTGRNAGVVKASAPAYHRQTPDLDKLVRAALDALTGVLWRDDSQVCGLTATKAWTEGGPFTEFLVTL